MRMLIVDDDFEICEALKEELSACIEGLEIDCATNGLDAFILCQGTQYDHIITDHVMPIMTGTALVASIRSRENENIETPITMITGYSTEGLGDMPHLEGVDFVTKPLSVEKLLRIIAKRIRA